MVETQNPMAPCTMLLSLDPSVQLPSSEDSSCGQSLNQYGASSLSLPSSDATIYS